MTGAAASVMTTVTKTLPRGPVTPWHRGKTLAAGSVPGGDGQDPGPVTGAVSPVVTTVAKTLAPVTGAVTPVVTTVVGVVISGCPTWRRPWPRSPALSARWRPP